MAKIPDSIRETVQKYIAELAKNDIPLNKAYLFGSYTAGRHDKWSDIDIALVSEAFKGDLFDI